MKKNTGFTLIEILIAMAIFSLIALGTAGAISRGIAVKKRVETEWEEIHGIRTTMNLFGRDISLAFHVKKKSQPNMFDVKEESPYFKTFFTGKSHELSFTSLAHRKFYQGTHESDVTEIGYRLETDPQNASLYQIVRREDPIVDDEPDKGGETQIMIDGIKAMEIKYYSLKQERWMDDWDTHRRDYLDQFPDAVHIKLVFQKGDTDLEYSTKVLIANPNNVSPKAEPGGSGTEPGAPPKTPSKTGEENNDGNDN